MAAPNSRSSVRIRVTTTVSKDLRSPNDEFIHSFWLHVPFDLYPSIRDVEKRILSLINSPQASKTILSRSGLLQEDESNDVKSRSSTTLTYNRSRSTSSSKRLRHKDQDLVASNCLSCDSSAKSIQKYHLYDNNDNHHNVYEPLLQQNGSRCSSSHNDMMVSCQLFLEGFHILPNESSEILRDDDLITVKGTWFRNATISLSPASKSQPKEKTKKRKKDHSIFLDDDEDFTDRNFSDGISDAFASTNSSSASKSNPKKKAKKIKKDNSTILNDKDFHITDRNFSDNICNNVANTSPYSALESDLKKKTTEKKKKDYDNEATNENSDLLLLLNKRIEKLSEKEKNLSEKSTCLSKDQNMETETFFCNGTEELLPGNKLKRKRHRRRKKKTSDTSVKNIKEMPKLLEKNEGIRSSSLNLPIGQRPENKRLTFQSDSDNDFSMNDAIDEPESISKHKKDTELFAQENSGTDKEQITNEEGGEKSDHTTKAKNISKKMLNSVGMILSLVKPQPFAQGKNLDPNTNFDELLQRRRLTGNSYSVGNLCNGAYVFTREKQTEKGSYDKMSQLQISAATESFSPVPSSREKGLHEPDSKVMLTEEDRSNPQTISDTVENEVTPVCRDVEHYKPLEGDPQPGDIIAYKILELSDDYTPNMSDFKQGQVIACEGTVVQLELFNSVSKKRTGRFELMYDEDEEEKESQANYVSVELSDMVDARLVQRHVEKGSQ